MKRLAPVGFPDAKSETRHYPYPGFQCLPEWNGDRSTYPPIVLNSLQLCDTDLYLDKFERDRD